MLISDICIRRPVLAIVINLMMVLVGLVAFDRLSVREYPNIDQPVVTVETTYPGASAEIMESQVTTPLEDVLSGIEGIDFLKSISRSELSQITVAFNLERSPDAAASEVRDRVARARASLPLEIREPVVAKVEADAQPIMWLTLYSDKHNELEVGDYAERVVVDRIQSLPGVSSIRYVGQRRYSMRIWLDPARLAGHNLTVQEVESAIRQQNVEIPSGRIEGVEREFTVLAETGLKTPEEFASIIVKSEGQRQVKLGDVGQVELGPEDDRRYARFNGKKAVGIGVIKVSTANPLEVSKAVRQEMAGIQAELPKGMQLSVSYDTSMFIEASIKSVTHVFFEAVALVTLVIIVFLRNFRASLIPLVAIPVSVVVSFAIMYYLGFTINTLTLLALVLAIGLVVDDAIVVLENAVRHSESGMPPMEAASKAMKEIGFAVIAMTLTLAAVFAPIAFTPGKTGRLFTEFALTLAGAVLVSGITALTLTPMMCARFLKPEVRNQKSEIKKKHFMDKLEGRYTSALGRFIVVKGYVISGAVAVSLVGYFFLTQLKSELSPVEDRGVIIGVAFGPEGATPESVNRDTMHIEDIYAKTPEVDRYLAIVGFPVSNRSMQIGILKDWSMREKTQMQIVNELKPKFAAISGINAFPNNRLSFGQGALSKPVEFVLQTTNSYFDLEKMVSALLAEMGKNPGFLNTDSDLKLNKPEVKVRINREKAAQMGITVESIGRTLETLLGSRQVTVFQREGKQYYVLVQIADDLRMTPDDLGRIYMRAQNGDMVQLSNLATLHEGVAPRELNHFGKLRSATITASLEEDYSLGEALKFLEEKAANLDPRPTSVNYGGNSRDYKLTGSSMLLTFGLALAFIYLVLAAQFESFATPLVIMLSVPLAFTGAVITLYFVGGSNNIYSQIGLITLIGLITKNGILIVEFANHLRFEGRNLRSAVLEAARLRLRPILMTTIATVLGAMPLALAAGAGSESRMQIGWVVVGGMTFGTLFTLFVIPCFYLLAGKLLGWEKSASSEKVINTT